MSEPVVAIAGIAAGGDGVGRLPDGRAVFVPRTAPGDTVRLGNVRLAKRFARAEAAEIVTPGPDRVVPACDHYERDRCGGCQLQHLSGAAQQAIRVRLVGDALRRIGKLDIEDPLLEPSPAAWAYRTRVTLAADPFPGRGGERTVGFHRVGDPGALFPLDRCQVATESVQAFWDVVRGARRTLPPALDRLSLRHDRRGGRHLIARTSDARVWTTAETCRADLAEAGIEATLWWHPPEGAARVVAGPRTEEGNEEGVRGPFPATAFQQVHPAMGDRVRRYAVARVAAAAGDHVWDLYAGIGETSALLRETGAAVESVERDPKATRLAARECDPGVVVHTGTVEALLGRLRRPDLVLVNPPRTGLGPGVAAAVAASGARRTVYVSCDPATLARDLMPFVAAGWRVTAIRAFDLFPQTAHVETVVTVEHA